MSVQRQRLLRLLAEPASTSAVLLVAPPGYGKTVLLQQYAEDERLVYMNLSTVTTREALVRELIGTLAPRTVRSLGTLLGQQANAGFDAILTTWMLVRLRSIETTIVLDDLQHIAGDESAMQLLAALVEGTRSHIRWILSSRQMPILPIGTWIAHSMTTLPVTERDLSFTLDEARIVASSANVAIDDSDLAQIVRHNAGWPIGTRLSIEAWDRFRSTQPLLTETRTVLFNYLQTELWKNLTRVQHELILACALLPQITTDVLDEAGYAHSARQLGTLERVIPFVTKNPDGSYSIHELFRDFALEASRQNGGLIQRVLGRVGDALARRGRFVESVALAIRAHVPESMLTVLAAGGLTLLETGGREIVTEAIAALPPPQREHATVCALRGAIAHSDGSVSNGEGLYRAALSKPELPAPLRLEVARRLGAIASNRGDGRAAVAILEPLLLDGTLSADQRVDIAASAAAAYSVAGDLDRARETIESVRGMFDHVGVEARARALGRTAFALFNCGDLEPARQCAIDASSLAHQVGLDREAAAAFSVLYSIASFSDPDGTHLAFYARECATAGERAADRGIQFYGLCAELTALAEAGDKSGADRVLATLDAIGQANTHRNQFDVRIARAVLEAGTGDPGRAASMLKALPESSTTPAERLLITSILALIDLLDGRRDEAIEKIAPALLFKTTRDFLSERHVYFAQTLRGFALWLLDRRAQAERTLRFESASVGVRDSVLVDAVREIVHLSHPIPTIDLVDGPCERLQQAGLGAYATMIRRLANYDKSEVIITPAELQMLRAFYEFGGRTNDVAAALKKSPYTIRNQIRSTISKLGCAGRNEAIVYARQRGWF